MSANHARRHRSRGAEVIYLSGRPSQQVARLIDIRDCIATCAAEYAAHGTPGVDVIVRCVADVELLIRTESAGVYEREWVNWAQRNADLAHTAPSGHPACRLCLAARKPNLAA